MTPEIALVLALVVVTMVLLVGEWLPVDVVALGLVVTLVVSEVLSPAEAFAGFASDVIVALAAIFVLAGALEETGVMGWIASSVRRLGGRREGTTVAATMGLSAGLSALLSNTSVTAVMMPGILQRAREIPLAPSRLLIPLAYASMLGGTCTLIGTSTNLAASGLMERLGLEPISLFELAPVGIAMTFGGIAYMALVGRHLLPERGAAESLSATYHLRSYLSELVIGENATIAGRRLDATDLGEEDVQVLAVSRGEQKLAPDPRLVLRPGDMLLTQGPRESLLRLSKRPGLSLEAAPELADKDLVAGGTTMAEAVVLPGSPLLGRTLLESRFRQTYGASVLAILRHAHSIPVNVAEQRLREGDLLLLLVPEESLARLGEAAGVLVVGQIEALPVSRSKGFLALAALVSAIVVGALGWLPLSVALLAGAVVAVAARCISKEDVYHLVEWKLLILIGGMTALGVAMEETGAATLLAQVIAERALPLGIPFVFAAFAALTMLLTQPLSNAAAALVVLPIAVSTAGAIGVDPRSLAILVTLSASLSFVAPLEPACLLVYAPGRYAFRDFVKAGLPLSALAIVVLLVLVPMLWPP